MIRTLIRNLLLFLALACFLAAAFALGLDALRLSSGGPLTLTPLGEFWNTIDPESLDFVRRALPQAAWDKVGVWLLLQPACAVMGFFGFFLLVLRPMQERRRGLTD